MDGQIPARWLMAGYDIEFHSSIVRRAHEDDLESIWNFRFRKTMLESKSL